MNLNSHTEQPQPRPCSACATSVAAGRSRELYTPRRTHPHPSLPAWRRKYWEEVRKCKEVNLLLRRRAASDWKGKMQNIFLTL